MRDTEWRTLTAEERLSEIGRRIDMLDSRAHTGSLETRAGMQRRVARLRAGEASARTAVHSAVARIEENTLALEAKADLAEHAAAADLADDSDAFLGAVSDELRSWDVYLERLQVKVATTAGDGRSEAEEAIGELRRSRHAFALRLPEVHSTSGEAWREVRGRVQAARRALEAQAAEVEATLARGGTG